MKIQFEIEAIPLPTKTITVIDHDAVIDLVLAQGSVTFVSEGNVMKETKPAYVAALRRGIKLRHRQVMVGGKVVAATLSVTQKGDQS